MADRIVIPNHRDSGTQSVVLCPEDSQWHHAHNTADGRRICGKCLTEGK